MNQLTLKSKQLLAIAAVCILLLIVIGYVDKIFFPPTTKVHMKAHIHNANVNVFIEGDTELDIVEKFLKENPEQKNQAVTIEWIKEN